MLLQIPESFDAAKEYRNKFRPTVTPVYDPERPNLHAIPPMVNAVEAVEAAEAAEAVVVVDAVGAVGGNGSVVNDAGECGDNVQHEDEQKVVVVPKQMDQLDLYVFDALVSDVENGSNENVASGSNQNVEREANQNVESESNQNNAETAVALANNATESSGNENEENSIQNASETEASIDKLVASSGFNSDTQLIEQNDPLGTSDDQIKENPGSNQLPDFGLNHTEEASIRHDDRRLKITEKISDDIEITYHIGQIYRPFVDSFEVKRNDVLSGNLPLIEV